MLPKGPGILKHSAVMGIFIEYLCKKEAIVCLMFIVNKARTKAESASLCHMRRLAVFRMAFPNLSRNTASPEVCVAFTGLFL